MTNITFNIINGTPNYTVLVNDGEYYFYYTTNGEKTISLPDGEYVIKVIDGLDCEAETTTNIPPITSTTTSSSSTTSTTTTINPEAIICDNDILVHDHYGAAGTVNMEIACNLLNTIIHGSVLYSYASDRYTLSERITIYGSITDCVLYDPVSFTNPLSTSVINWLKSSKYAIQFGNIDNTISLFDIFKCRRKTNWLRNWY